MSAFLLSLSKQCFLDRKCLFLWVYTDSDIYNLICASTPFIYMLTIFLYEDGFYCSLLYPQHNEVVGRGGGYIDFTPSVRPSVRPSVPHPVSALLRLQFWLDPFHINITYQATKGVLRVKFLAKFQNLNFWQFLKICNFDFVSFWLGIWCESLVWVITGWRGVSQNVGVLVVLV